MKYFIVLSFFALLAACNGNEATENDEAINSADTKPASETTVSKDTTKKSIPSETVETVGGATIKINYHSPAVRGRVIWGGLVPYDAVWVTGAHKATTLHVNKDFTIGNRSVPAGKYALFTIPGKDKWTVIINKNWNQHLADDYKESEDLVRIKVKPQSTGENTERLKYAIEPKGQKAADILISWEKLKVPFRIEIK